MNKLTSPIILAVGAHVGDMELTAGGLLSACSMQGWTPVIISLTTSEKSAQTADHLDKFIEMKGQEATAFAKELHGRSILYDIPDGFLLPTDSLCLELCALIRKLQPQILITHYQSAHKDHMACHTIVNHAVFYASLPAVKCEYPAYNVPEFYYTENWEDDDSFRPQTYFDISDGFSLWQKALEKEQSVQNCPFMPIVEYYRLKARTNGILMNCKYAEVFMKSQSIRSLMQGKL